ncbi:RHS repeat-associated core domain-containing protein [Streptomyces sp. NPDC059909]|uniref:RHS repeat-associated core domain-containing protein n=1 Tax=Streptomyces sp. NPDC059909 TaxID=3346998 RepID=UPI00365F0C38
MSSEVFSEELDGTLARTYRFGLGGERLSQLNHLNGDSGYYGYNSHGDVETFTSYDGTPTSTYGYTAYGQDVRDEWTGLDSISASDDEGTNPYRFNGKRWNAQSETYDMGFRDYSPEHNRFISRDSYTGAAADMSLGAGAATSNRYGFAGGNPVSNIERDGHEACDVGCQARNQYQMGGDPIIPDPERLEFNVQYHDGSTGLENWVDPWDFVKELSGFSDIQGCSNSPSAWQCTMAAAAVFPGAGKALKGAKWADEAVEAASDAPKFLKRMPIAEKNKSRMGFRYQKHVTGQDDEQIWRLNSGIDSGRRVEVDGGPTDGWIVESKWTQNEYQWEGSPYHPSNYFSESTTVDQARRLLALNSGLGGKGVRYAVSSPQGAAFYRGVLREWFPEEMANGTLAVWHVSAKGMQ